MASVTKAGTVADVTIIGGGPAGLSLGAALKLSPVTRHLDIKIIESMPLVEKLDKFYQEDFEMTNRVVSLTPKTISYFEKIGSWDLMKHERVQSYDDMIITDGVSDVATNFASDNIATMAEVLNIQSSLYQRIKQLGGIEIIDGSKVVDIVQSQTHYQWPELTLDNGDKITTRLLVGCDGANSPVRKFANIEKRGWAYDRFGVVATLTNEWPSLRLPTAWQRFLPQGPILLLPLPNDQMSLVWSTTPELSSALLQCSPLVFMKLINAAYRLEQDELNYLYEMLLSNDAELESSLDWRLEQFMKNKTTEELDGFPIPILTMIEKSRARFPLRLSHADTYVSDRVALVGDAAHTIHPLAGQGLNLGQLDVASLAHAIETGVSRGLDIGSMLCLEPYFSDRYIPNHVMLGICDKIHKVYSNHFWPVVLLRTLGVSILNQLPFVKSLMVQNISHK